ncbi:hypothetical protein ACLI1A_10060 [Flavobacterium sp. RHBU_3]|uniref:hypothetical protein n=1 Tax=Flavobacterium sp. RHBU_3 TaxID=3391184 RepID=UPI00398553E2
MPIQITAPSEPPITSTAWYQAWLMPLMPIEVAYYQGGATPASVTVPVQIRAIIGTGPELMYSSFTYRSYFSLPPMPEVVDLSGPVITDNEWLPYTNSLGGDVTITFQNLNLLSPGTYTRQVTFEIRGTNAAGASTIIDKRSFTIIIHVFTADTPVITPFGFNFNWVIDGGDTYIVSTTPVNVNGASWSIEAPLGFVWLPVEGAEVSGTVPSIITGTGSLDINMAMFVGAMPNPIIENPLTLYADVNGGLIQLPVTATFVQENGLFLEKEVLYFEALKGLTEAEAQTVVITFPASYSFTKPSWLTLSPTSGNGTITLVVQPIASANMDGGTYTGDIVLKNASGDIIGTISVTYFVNDAINMPYVEGDYAFTLDKLFMEFSAPGTTYFQVDLRARVYDYFGTAYQDRTASFKAPLFNGFQKLNIGKPVHQLMKRPEDLGNNNQLMYKPAEVYLDVTQYAGGSTFSYALGPYYFIAGISPALLNKCAFLDISPGARRVTATSYHIVNMLITGSANIRVFRNGAPVSGFSMQPGIRQYRMNFAQWGAVQGDVFDIVIMFPFQTRSLKRTFIVFPEGYTSCHVVWENEHRLRSVLECTGKVKLKNAFTNRTQELEQDLVTVLDKLESEKTSTITINTGWILKSEKAFIESLSRSPKATLLINNTEIDMVPVPKELVTVDTDESLVSFDLEFQINRKTNEEIYSF